MDVHRTEDIRCERIGAFSGAYFPPSSSVCRLLWLILFALEYTLLTSIPVSIIIITTTLDLGFKNRVKSSRLHVFVDSYLIFAYYIVFIGELFTQMRPPFGFGKKKKKTFLFTKK